MTRPWTSRTRCSQSGSTSSEKTSRTTPVTRTREPGRQAPLRTSSKSPSNVSVASAAKAAGLLERRDVDPTWKQIAATLRGRAEEKRGALDAAAAAYARALEQNARTPSAATAALNLGRLETSAADHDKARDHLTEAVERANTPELVDLRVLAYAALAENEEKRGDREAALKYHLLVGTLFDHAVHTPKSLAAAAAILDESNRKKEADALRMELKTRYGK